MNDSFCYKFKIRLSDLWQASMYYAYSSYMGVVNIVCIAAAVILIVSRWKTAGDIFRTVMVLFLLMFTVIQPLVILYRANASINGAFHELELTFSRTGMTIVSDGQREDKPWSDVKGIVKKPTIMIVYTGNGGGYILRNSVLKETRKPLYDFAMQMIKDHKKGQA